MALHNTTATGPILSPSTHQDLLLSSSSSGCYTCFDDASWAIKKKKDVHPTSLHVPHRPQAYQDFMEKCRIAAGPEHARSLCDDEDAHRLYMNREQPRSMYNYTTTGFSKHRVPDRLRQLLETFWNDNYEQGVETEMNKPASAYHNQWDAAPRIVQLANPRLKGGGPALMAAVANQVRPLVEEWTGMKQAMTAVYGIRIYGNQSILAPHVDQLPRVASAIINVAQDVDTPWPLEVYDHDGFAHNITMEPWDLVLYESHSVIHGRPYPFDGTMYANVFVHFQPIEPLNDTSKSSTPFREGNDENEEEEESLPPYLIPDTPWEEEWWEDNPDGWTLLTDVRKLARTGDLATMRHVAHTDPAALGDADEQGWNVLHEAVSCGHLEMVRFLVEEQGFNVNDPTNVRDLSTPLAIAMRYLRTEHSVTQYLLANGGQILQSEHHLNDEDDEQRGDTNNAYEEENVPRRQHDMRSEL